MQIVLDDAANIVVAHPGIAGGVEGNGANVSKACGGNRAVHATVEAGIAGKNGAGWASS